MKSNALYPYLRAMYLKSWSRTFTNEEAGFGLFSCCSVIIANG